MAEVARDSDLTDEPFGGEGRSNVGGVRLSGRWDGRVQVLGQPDRRHPPRPSTRSSRKRPCRAARNRAASSFIGARLAYGPRDEAPGVPLLAARLPGRYAWDGFPELMRCAIHRNSSCSALVRRMPASTGTRRLRRCCGTSTLPADLPGALGRTGPSAYHLYSLLCRTSRKSGAGSP